MNSKKTGKFLTVAFLICCSHLLLSQSPYLVAPTMILNQDDVVEVELKVGSITDILAIQFTFAWDPAVLAFQESETSPSFAIDILSFQYTTELTDQGKFTMAWDDATLSGLNLADSTALVRLQFRVIGAPGSVTPLAFTDDPTRLEVADIDGNPIEGAIFEDGQITVFDPTTASIDRTPKPTIQIDNCFPNPFQTNTELQFTLSQATSMQWKIYTAEGTILKTQEQRYASGQHRLQLPQEYFVQSGLYMLELRAADFVITQKLICLQY